MSGIISCVYSLWSFRLLRLITSASSELKTISMLSSRSVSASHTASKKNFRETSMSALIYSSHSLWHFQSCRLLGGIWVQCNISLMQSVLPEIDASVLPEIDEARMRMTKSPILDSCQDFQCFAKVKSKQNLESFGLTTLRSQN